ncbi:MAG: hypothetical protein RL274_2179 [Pseudomonadota bacterium]|jgi:ribulose kinase
MFWRKKKKQVEQAVDEVALATNDLMQKTMVIGQSGVMLLLGAAMVGAAATYYVTKTRKGAKTAPDANPALPSPSQDDNKKAAR